MVPCTGAYPFGLPALGSSAFRLPLLLRRLTLTACPFHAAASLEILGTPPKESNPQMTRTRPRRSPVKKQFEEENDKPDADGGFAKPVGEEPSEGYRKKPRPVLEAAEE